MMSVTHATWRRDAWLLHLVCLIAEVVYAFLRNSSCTTAAFKCRPLPRLSWLATRTRALLSFLSFRESLMSALHGMLAAPRHAIDFVQVVSRVRSFAFVMAAAAKASNRYIWVWEGTAYALWRAAHRIYAALFINTTHIRRRYASVLILFRYRKVASFHREYRYFLFSFCLHD